MSGDSMNLIFRLNINTKKTKEMVIEAKTELAAPDEHAVSPEQAAAFGAFENESNGKSKGL